jgi:hypothetical protein
MLVGFFMVSPFIDSPAIFIINMALISSAFPASYNSLKAR